VFVIVFNFGIGAGFVKNDEEPIAITNHIAKG